MKPGVANITNYVQFAAEIPSITRRILFINNKLLDIYINIDIK